MNAVAQRLADQDAPYTILEICPGIFRIPIPLPRNPLRELNAYLVRGRERSLLIDTGFRLPECRQAMAQSLRAIGAEGDPLDIFLTHIHTDHMGLASELVRPGGTIYVGQLDFPFTSQTWEDNYWRVIDRRFLAEGFPKEELAVTTATNPARTLGADLDLPNYRAVKDGEVISVGDYTLEVVATPGHTPGQLCLWLASEGILFTADHVLFDITPNITAWPGYQNPLGGYLRSLERVRKLPVTLPLPAHRTVQTGFIERVDEIMTHHQRRCQEALTVLAREPGLNAYQLTAQMTWQIRCKGWDDFPVPQKWFAAGEAVAHLEYLMDLGKVRRTWGEPCWRYEVISE